MKHAVADITKFLENPEFTLSKMIERVQTHSEKPMTKEAEPLRRALRIGIMGAMASGKSTLAGLLGEKWGASPIEERFEDNPYLADFYDNPEKVGMSFKTQICFLGLKVEQMKARNIEEREVLVNANKLILPQVEIFVPTIEMDALYGQVQAEMGLMGTREYDTYTMMYEIFKREIVIPVDLYIFVDAPAEVLLERILDIRKRKCEHPEFFEKYPDYLPRLATAGRQWHKDTSSKHPVVLVDTVNNNFADDVEEGEKILERIEDEIKKFLISNPYANKDTEILYGRDGAQLIIPDCLKTR